MSIDYSGALVVGLPREQMAHLREDGYWDEEGVLEHIPPFYDADCGIVGLYVETSGVYSYRKIQGTLDDKIIEAKLKFKEITGLDGFAYITCVGY